MSSSTSPAPTPVAGATRSILVLGATGRMGGEVVRALLALGATPRVLVRDPSRLPSTDGLDVVVGDLRDPESLRRAVEGTDAVFHMSPHEADEVELARTVIRVCEAAGARIVFAGVHVGAGHPVVQWLKRRVYGMLLRRYRGKFALARLVERSATDPVLLVPTNFMQCDEIFLDDILGGAFVQPMSPKGLNRVDVRDIGEAAARILLDPGFPAGSYPVVGPASLSGPECAEVWSRALGRPVEYADDDAALEARLARRLSGRALEDWLSSLRTLRGFAVPTSPTEVATTQRLLGRAPTRYADFVARTVRDRRMAVASPPTP